MNKLAKIAYVVGDCGGNPAFLMIVQGEKTIELTIESSMQLAEFIRNETRFSIFTGGQ